MAVLIVATFLGGYGFGIRHERGRRRLAEERIRLHLGAEFSSNAIVIIPD